MAGYNQWLQNKIIHLLESWLVELEESESNLESKSNLESESNLKKLSDQREQQARLTYTERNEILESTLQKIRKDMQDNFSYQKVITCLSEEPLNSSKIYKVAANKYKSVLKEDYLKKHLTSPKKNKLKTKSTYSSITKAGR